MSNSINNPIPLYLLGTPHTENLVNDIKTKLNYVLGKGNVESEIVSYGEFANWETNLEIANSVRGKIVFVIADPNGRKKIKIKKNPYKEIPSLNDNLVHSLLLVQTTIKNGATKTHLVYPCYPYSRQDKPTSSGNRENAPRQASSAQFVADVAEMLGVDHFVNVDVHNTAIANSFKKTKFINLFTGRFVQEAVNDMVKNGFDIDNIELTPTDEGGSKKNKAIAADLGLSSNAIVYKYRKKGNEVDRVEIYGRDVDGKDAIEGKDVLIHDDILDTGGTLEAVIEEMRKKNPKSVNIAITHGMFNLEAKAICEKLYKEGKIQNLYVSNSIYREKEDIPEFVKIIDTTNILSNTIVSIFKNRSINYNNNHNPASTD